MLPRTGWLQKAGSYRVEHIPCPNPGQRVPVSEERKGVLHTTEGSSIEGALSVFRQHSAPQFMVGPDLRGKIHVIQMVPLGIMGAALENHAGGVETNRLAYAQIEIVGFSKKERWLPAKPTLDALVALVRTLRNEVGIPARHVAAKRSPAMWERGEGWFGHVDVPENSHWDPGNFNYPLFFAMVSAKPAPPTKVTPKPRKGDKLRTYRLVRRANGLVYTEPTKGSA